MSAADASAEPVVLVLMGVSGSGKSTVAAVLAGALGWELKEGDNLHPDSNVAKMAAGTPLTDEDRWPWLSIVASWISDKIAAGESGIITCSALRRVYRDRLRQDGVTFVHLHGSREQLEKQIGGREGHFMPAALLDSQLATLEPIEPDENAIVVQIGRSLGELVEEIISRLYLA